MENKKLELTKKICEECKKEFETPGTKRGIQKRFCCRTCAQRYNGKLNKGRKHTEETKKKLSELFKGKNNPFYGKKHIEKTKQKIKQANTGKKHSEEANKRKGRSGKENAFYGKKHTEASLKKMSEVKKGKNNPFYGKKHTEKTREERTGEKNPAWQGGTSFEDYGREFNDILKEEIKQRENYVCFICEEKNITLCIHHIDYNKKNNSKNNLVALCSCCHGKTGFNRERWIRFFNGK